MSALPKMTDDSSLQRSALWQRVQDLRSLGAEHNSQDPIVIVARSRNQGKSPLKVQNVCIVWKILGQLFV
jgi:hypothetical protein